MPPDLAPQTRAALLWQAWNHYTELVVLKRFTRGHGGSDVLVVRPQLRTPQSDTSSLETSGPARVFDRSWGSCLLVKTGKTGKVRKEWDRCAAFLADRLHPFLSRCEAFLPIRPPEHSSAVSDSPNSATLISSFLGGDLLHPEPLDEIICGISDLSRCKRLLDKAFAVLAPWQAHAETHELSEWRRVYRSDPKNPENWVLFNKFDLTKKRGDPKLRGREEFAAGLRWDTSFISEEHLSDHLMGKNRDGLLFELRKIQARFSLTHGDVNPRNVMCEGDAIWLIDFEHTGVAPTLIDFARLEANLRLWCLPLRPAGENVEDVAREFESRLLDHFLGSEGGIEPTRELAGSLGAKPDDLHKVAHCIAHIRRLASVHCLTIYPDRRDYLAVLYLTVLSLLQYAGRRMAPPENYRVLVSLAWVIEEALDRILGRKPHDRKRTTMKPHHLLTPDWVLPPGAPQRVMYFLDREDGRQALPSLAACRGVLQFPPHHLDVLDHTLLVLANVEDLLGADDPLAYLLDPAVTDRRVEEDLHRQGIHFLPIPPPEAGPPQPDTGDLELLLDPIRERLRPLLAEPSSRLLLKWAAVLHDVGKPGSRSVNTEKWPLKVQFIGHEYYGTQLVDEFIQLLMPESTPTARPGGQAMSPAKGTKPKAKVHEAESPANGRGQATRSAAQSLSALQRLRRMLPSHHMHHQVVQRYQEHPESLRALIEGLKTRDVPQAEYDNLARYLEPDLVYGQIAGYYQPDFPLLILFGFADRLACRGPNNTTSVSATARADLAVLAFWAFYPEIRARYLKRKRKQEQSSHVFKRLSDQLRAKSGHDEKGWERIGLGVLGQVRRWFNAERKGGKPMERAVRSSMSSSLRAWESWRKCCVSWMPGRRMFSNLPRHRRNPWRRS